MSHCELERARTGSGWYRLEITGESSGHGEYLPIVGANGTKIVKGCSMNAKQNFGYLVFLIGIGTTCIGRADMAPPEEVACSGKKVGDTCQSDYQVAGKTASCISDVCYRYTYIFDDAGSFALDDAGYPLRGNEKAACVVCSYRNSISDIFISPVPDAACDAATNGNLATGSATKTNPDCGCEISRQSSKLEFLPTMMSAIVFAIVLISRRKRS